MAHAPPFIARAKRVLRRWTGMEARVQKQRHAAFGDGLIQPSAITKPNRYPRIFAFVSRELGSVPVPRLLSFGCSTGEEAFALRRHFPTAIITALDIDPDNIAQAQVKLADAPDPNIHFGVASSPAHLPSEEFDAVFCMAVLRHGALCAERSPRCDHLIRFETIEALATDLARCVRPGGFLSLWNTQFPFALMAVSAQFEPVMQVEIGAKTNQPLYGPDNRRIDDMVLLDAVYRKADPR